MEAHVIRHEDVIETRGTHALEERAPHLEGPREHLSVGERTYGNLSHAESRYLRSRKAGSFAPSLAVIPSSGIPS
jgi:hypothetical protein